MAQQYDPVTWRNVAMPDNQTSLIKMAADRSNLLNDVINSFQSRDKQILDRNVNNLNAMETYNTKEQSAKIIQALSGVANPSADGARVLADTIGRLDPNMLINKAELYNTGFNAIDKLTEGVKNKLGIQQTQNEMALEQGRIKAATQSLTDMGLLPKGTLPDPSHIAQYNQAIERQQLANSTTTANAAQTNARANMEQVYLTSQRVANELASGRLTREEASLRINQEKKKIEQDRLLTEINNTLSKGENINPSLVDEYTNNGGDRQKLVELVSNNYYKYNPDKQAVINQSTAFDKIINDYYAKSGAATAEEMEFFNDHKNATYKNMVNNMKGILIKNGYRDPDKLDLAVEKALNLTRGIVDHKNATEYNHNLFKPSGNEATDPEKVVLSAADQAVNFLISQDKFGNQAKLVRQELNDYVKNQLSGKN